MKDPGEYYDDLERMWQERGVTVEPFEAQNVVLPTFTYLPGRRPYSRAQVLARLIFPLHPRAYMRVHEYLVGERSRIHREAYVYQLVYDGGDLEHWHRHRHAADHRHSDGARVYVEPISMKDALDGSLRLLWEEKVPEF